MKKRMFVEYLEQLVLEDECTDKEYGLYLEYKEFGDTALKDPSNKNTRRGIVKKYNDTFDAEG